MSKNKGRSPRLGFETENHFNYVPDLKEIQIIFMVNEMGLIWVSILKLSDKERKVTDPPRIK